MRVLHKLEFHPIEGGYRFEFASEGFLYKMVRNLMGTLLEIGAEKLPAQEIPQIFEKRNRKAAPAAAAAKGLFLHKVDYPF
mgnify:CR=1 FL=1